jgi:hypothetical protein
LQIRNDLSERVFTSRARGEDNSTEVGVKQFYNDMKHLFEKAGRKNPNYAMIAQIANLFNLSSKEKKENHARQAMYELRKNKADSNKSQDSK